jgi:phosphohistidine swiveling domain-containing protein
MWRKNFEITRVDYSICIESNDGFRFGEKAFLGKVYISHSLWLINNLNVEFFVIKEELQKSIRAILKKLVSNPDFVSKLHDKTIRYNKQYFDLAERIRKLNLKKLSNRELLNWHAKLYKLQGLSHGLSLCTTWWVDSDGEDLTHYLMNIVKNRLQGSGLKADPATVFSVLTTPAAGSLSQQEESESLAIVAWIRRQLAVKKLFQKYPVEKLAENFSQLPAVAKNKFTRHWKKWKWAPYNYLGPAYELDYYLQVWAGLIKQNLNPEEVLAQAEKKRKSIQVERKNLIRKLGLSELERKLFDIAAEIVWIKAYRKDCYYHGFFVSDLLLAEMGRRVHLSLLQMKYLSAIELPLVFAGKDMSAIANLRMKRSVIYNSNGKISIFHGEGAKKFLKKQKFEKIKISRQNNWQGTTACSGKVKGEVRVINLPEEMGKMQLGDIMVSHTTYPALVPAMKKASAIVTEDGGITCHAAIVARELQTPCVVGVKNILRVLKDGDRVEVDATKGIVKKI